MNLPHQVHHAPGGVRVVLSGEIDMAVREDLRRVLAAAVAASAVTELDLHQVTLLDCLSIGELMRARREARHRGRSLVVIRPQGIVREVLDLTDVLPLLAPDLTARSSKKPEHTCDHR